MTLSTALWMIKCNTPCSYLILIPCFISPVVPLMSFMSIFILSLGSNQEAWIAFCCSVFNSPLTWKTSLNSFAVWPWHFGNMDQLIHEYFNVCLSESWFGLYLAQTLFFSARNVWWTFFIAHYTITGFSCCYGDTWHLSIKVPSEIMNNRKWGLH